MPVDDMKDSFYLRAMRTSIGAALRQQYAIDEPLTERLVKLLKELDEVEAQPGVTSENAPSSSDRATKKRTPKA
jgi:hypothetical protein